LDHLDIAPPAEKAELLLVLGQRADRDATDILIKHAASTVHQARLAALESLRLLAPPEALAPLLDIAASSKTDDIRQATLRALYVLCDASPDKEQAARSVVQAMNRFEPADRHHILPLLAELASPSALHAAQKASRDLDPAFAREAVRVLAQWPTAAPAAHLLELAGTGADSTIQTLALRAAIAVAAHEPDTSIRLALLQHALTAARGAEEKKQALGQIGQVPTLQALELALDNLTNPALGDEASLAAVSIAEKLEPDPKLADIVAAKVLSQVRNSEVTRRAWALRGKPLGPIPFIREWVVSDLYSQPGITGPQGVFDIPFPPEKTGQKTQWRTVPPADHVNLSQLFPGAENCAAYLRTLILAQQDASGLLLLGSDDGIKAWLNGQVIHGNNSDRGMVADQDAAPIQLRKGTNELMLKITQGGGGWSACARIAGTDGQAIPGLLVKLPTLTAAPAPVHTP
jgi:hypothetical protein